MRIVALVAAIFPIIFSGAIYAEEIFLDSTKPAISFQEADYGEIAPIVDSWLAEVMQIEHPECPLEEVFFRVFAVVPGSFTTKSDQLLVSADAWDYACLPWGRKTILLIIEDDRRVMYQLDVGYVADTLDFDSDGFDELVIRTLTGPQMGAIEGYFTVERFDGERFRSEASFLTTIDDCLAYAPGLGLEYRVLGFYKEESHLAFPSIRFEVEPFQGCDGYALDEVLRAKAYLKQAGESSFVVFDAITEGNEAFFSGWPHRLDSSYDFAELSVEGVIDEYGQTPLMYAAARDSSLIVEALIRGGSDVNEVSPEGWTPLMYAAKFHAPPGVIQALLAAGADRQLRNQDNQTARDLAVEFGSPFQRYF